MKSPYKDRKSIERRIHFMVYFKKYECLRKEYLLNYKS